MVDTSQKILEKQCASTVSSPLLIFCSTLVVSSTKCSARTRSPPFFCKACASGFMMLAIALRHAKLTSVSLFSRQHRRVWAFVLASLSAQDCCSCRAHTMAGSTFQKCATDACLSINHVVHNPFSFPAAQPVRFVSSKEPENSFITHFRNYKIKNTNQTTTNKQVLPV